MADAVVDTPLCSKKYPAQNPYSIMMPMITMILAGTCATSTVTLPLTDETTLDSGYEEVCEIRFCEDSYNIVLSSSTMWHCTIVKLSNAQKCVLEKMLIFQYLNYMPSVFVIVLVCVFIASVSTLSCTGIGSIARQCWPWSARLYISILKILTCLFRLH